MILSRLERFFDTAYGKDKMGVDTREAILYGQLHEDPNPLTVVGALKHPEGVKCFKIQQKIYTASKFYTMGIK